MNAALPVTNVGLLIAGSAHLAPVAGTHPAVVFAFLVGTLALGFGMERIEDFGNGNVGADA